MPQNNFVEGARFPAVIQVFAPAAAHPARWEAIINPGPVIAAVVRQYLAAVQIFYGLIRKRAHAVLLTEGLFAIQARLLLMTSCARMARRRIISIEAVLLPLGFAGAISVGDTSRQLAVQALVAGGLKQLPREI